MLLLSTHNFLSINNCPFTWPLIHKHKRKKSLTTWLNCSFFFLTLYPTATACRRASIPHITQSQWCHKVILLLKHLCLLLHPNGQARTISHLRFKKQVTKWEGVATGQNRAGIQREQPKSVQSYPDFNDQADSKNKHADTPEQSGKVPNYTRVLRKHAFR